MRLSRCSVTSELHIVGTAVEMAISKNDAVRHTGMALRDCQNRAEGSERG